MVYSKRTTWKYRIEWHTRDIEKANEAGIVVSSVVNKKKEINVKMWTNLKGKVTYLNSASPIVLYVSVQKKTFSSKTMSS